MQIPHHGWRRLVPASLLALAATQASAQTDPLLSLPPQVAEAIASASPARVAFAIAPNGPGKPTEIAQLASAVATAAERARALDVAQQRVDTAIGGAFLACVQTMAAGLSPCRDVLDKTIALLIPKGELARLDPPLMGQIYPAVLAEVARRNEPALTLKATLVALAAAMNNPSGPALETYVPPATAMLARYRQLPGRERLDYCLRLAELIQAQRQRDFQAGFVSVPGDIVNILTQRDVFTADPAAALAVIKAMFDLSRQPNVAAIPGQARARISQALKLNLPYLEPARPGVTDELSASFNQPTPP